MGTLDAKTVLVTGGSSGIGKACVSRYRAEGATVFVADLHPRSSDELALDVGDPAAWAALIESLPPLDVVHLNAGIITPGRTIGAIPALPLTDVTDDAYRSTMSANVDGVFFGARAVLPSMTERGRGDIIVTASIAGLVGLGGDIAYTTTKHAVVGLVKSLGSSLAQQGVDVCVSALCPGFVDTPLIAGAVHDLVAAMGIPIIEPDRVAEAAMQILEVRANGSQWIVWDDTIRQHLEPELL
ncbi:MAG: SDR family oxidoreductase [Actinomycetia bacterium]|nr:SDR family oxidoreductase [Actinomycetes bacterium]